MAGGGKRQREIASETPSRWVLGGVGALAILGATATGGLYLDYSSRFVTTDDAFIAARQFAVAPKVYRPTTSTKPPR